MDKIKLSFTVHFQFGASFLLKELITGVPGKEDPHTELIEKSKILFERCIMYGFNFKSFSSISDVADRLEELKEKSEFAFLTIAMGLVFFYAEGHFFYIDLSDDQFEMAESVIKYVKETILPKTKDHIEIDYEIYNRKKELLGES